MWEMILTVSAWTGLALYLLIAVLAIGFWVWMTWKPQKKTVSRIVPLSGDVELKVRGHRAC